MRETFWLKNIYVFASKNWDRGESIWGASLPTLIQPG
jgi:hypothetical protein